MQGQAHDLAGRRFALFGDGRLAAAVEMEFERRGACVERISRKIAKALARSDVECFLAVDDEHESNLRAALVVSRVAEDLPIVIRAFDPELADEIERGRHDGPFRVRAAYSVAHLAAPDFVAAALLADDEENILTLRLGDQYVNVCRIRVRRATRVWRLSAGRMAGRTPAKVLDAHGCQVLARRWSGLPWSAPGTDALQEGEELLVGGRLHDVLNVARRQGRRQRPGVRRATSSGRRRHPIASVWWSVTDAWAHATTLSMRVLIASFIALSAAVMALPAQGASGRFQLWVLTTLGSPPTSASGDQPDPIVSGIGLLAGGVALGLGISLMAAYFTERRLGEAMLRRARRLRRHVVVVGLGDVGLRVAQLLDTLGVPCAVLDTSPDAERDPRRHRRLKRSPVVPGELETGLRAAGVDRAAIVIASSENNLLNVEACLRAKREGPEEIRTIARIFDDVCAERGAKAFGVDEQIAAVTVAAPAFVEASLHDECLRTCAPEGHAMSALRWPFGQPVRSGQMERWHADGVRMLAIWKDAEGARAPTSEACGIEPDESAILAGPRDAVDAVVAELRTRSRRAAA